MKAIASIDLGNWLIIKVTPETPQEAAKIVQLGIARNAQSDKVSSFCFSEEAGVSCHVTLRPKRDNFGKDIKPYFIPKS